MLKFEVWQSIEVGVNPKTPDEFRHYMKKNDIYTDTWVHDFFGKPSFTVSIQTCKVNLAKITPANLGFTTRVTSEEICNRAQELGLVLCEPEDAPRLRVKYKKQPNRDCIVVYVKLQDIDMVITYGLTRDGRNLWLHGRIDNPKAIWSLDSEFIFRLPVQQEAS